MGHMDVVNPNWWQVFTPLIFLYICFQACLILPGNIGAIVPRQSEASSELGGFRYPLAGVRTFRPLLRASSSRMFYNFSRLVTLVDMFQ